MKNERINEVAHAFHKFFLKSSIHEVEKDAILY
jgi:hypothetical protein